jgi:hypothetical protein
MTRGAAQKKPPTADQGAPARSVADVEGFVGLLAAACNDPGINATLEQLLSMPDEKRRNLVHVWVSDLLIAEAPRELVEAVGCLVDDAIAEKAYEVIYRCGREK